MVWWEVIKVSDFFSDADSMKDHPFSFDAQSDEVETVLFAEGDPYNNDIPLWGHQVAEAYDMFSTYTPPSSLLKYSNRLV